MLKQQLDESIQPGMYDISNEAYHSSAGISRSGIMLFKKSPLHFWHKYLNQDRELEEQTPALVFGNALHTYVLEPDQFDKRFFVLPKVDRRTKEGKELWLEVQNVCGNKQTISQDDHEMLLKMAQAIATDQTAHNIIKAAQYEKSIYWNDPDTGVLCKCRPDILHTNMIADLKTTSDASESAFKRDVYLYGYHIQAAMIQEAMQHALRKNIYDFIFIAVEKSPPYAIAVYVLDEEAITKGKEEFKNILLQYKECLEKDCWPSYEVKQISLPSYAFY